MLGRGGEIGVLSRKGNYSSSSKKRSASRLPGVLFLGSVFALGLNFGSASPSLNQYFPFSVFAPQPTQTVLQLTDVIGRVRAYEGRLESRSSRLDEVLAAVTKLDIEPIYSDSDPEERIDVGGADEYRAPMFRNYMTHAPSGMPHPEQLVSAKLAKQLDFLSTVPIGYPVEGRVSSSFGKRRSPFTRRWHMHKGTDIAIDWHSPVVATADGVVVKAGSKGGYGRMVVIDHGNGIESVYGHLSSIQVNVGEKVCRGQRIALAGSTGRSTGPHVHYEVRVSGEHRDPADFLHLAKYLKYLPPLS